MGMKSDAGNFCGQLPQLPGCVNFRLGCVSNAHSAACLILESVLLRLVGIAEDG